MTAVAAGFWSQHGVHTLALAGPVVLFALLGLGADIRSWWRRGHRFPRWSLTHSAAALSVAAAAIHLGVCPEHFHEATLYGVFFAVAAAAQFGWAALQVARPARWQLTGGILGNASLVLLWAITRTVGVPLGPGAGEVERAGVWDVLSVACEIGLIALCAVLIAQGRRHSDVPESTLGALAA